MTSSTMRNGNYLENLMTKNSYVGKYVTQHTLEGEHINTYVSVDVAAKAVNVGRSNIIYALDSNYKTSGGYRWKLLSKKKSRKSKK